MQYEGHVIGLCQTQAGCRLPFDRRTAELEIACTHRWLRGEFQHRHTEFGRYGACWRVTASGHNQSFRFQVTQVKLKLIGAVGHVQGSGSAGAGHGYECGRHFRAVGQDNANAVTPSNAQGIEFFQRSAEQLVKAAVAQCLAVRCRHGRRIRRFLRVDGNHFGQC